MKGFKTFLLIPGIAFLFSNCNDTHENPSEKHFKVSDYSAIQIGGNAVVEVQPGSPATGSKTITIEGNPELVSEFQVQVVNGVLHINATKRVVLSDNIRVITPVSTLNSIVLEADQQAEVVWEEADENTILDQLAVKTEANSRLGLLGLKIRNINIQQEAQSKIFLNSASETGGEFKIEKENVEFLNDTTAIVNNETLLYFETSSVITEEDTEYYILSGENMRSFFIVENVNATLQATSEILGDECRVNHFDIKLEGQSTADIWVLKSLSGNGEGGSILYYYGNPSVSYATQGSAQIISW